MAELPAHRFGQVVGELLEEILRPVLLDFCRERDLYLDRHGARQGVRSGKKVSWTDKYGNSHDLDFVIEKDGSESAQGRPVAFIEAAWRRYTKHSRNKAQEIQGAVLPIAEKYNLDSPFLGAVLAGEFTEPSLAQLRSVGFELVHLSYESIVSAFTTVSIDARFNEATDDDDFAHCIRLIESLSSLKREALKRAIYQSGKGEFDRFFGALRHKLDRLIERVLVLPLFGQPMAFGSVAEAEAFIAHFDSARPAGVFHKYEVSITFTNGDEIRGTFSEPGEAVSFLHRVTS